MNKFFALVLLFNFFCYSQNDTYSTAFEISRNDLEQNVYSKDSTANALIIYDYGESWVDNNSYELNTKIKTKVKIINKNGFDRGEHTIYLYKGKSGNKERVKDIKATVYNLDDGKIVSTRMDKSAIYNEKYNDNFTIVKIVFPNIKEGSVITYSYTVTSPYMFKYYNWRFQDDIPTLYSEYNASIPGNWEYNIKLVGGKRLSTNTSTIKSYCLRGPNNSSSSCGVYKYVMKDIPAFIEEDFMTTKDNYLARIDYELKTFRGFNGMVDNITKTWKSVDGEIERDYDLGRQLKKLNTVSNVLDDSIKQNPNRLSKAKSIFKFVQDNYTWNEEFKVLRGIEVKDLIKNKSGNVGEINTLLHNLLATNNITASPILVSTRNNGLITQLYPVLSDFNYLIVKVDIDGKSYLLDATDDFVAFGQLPFRCLNQYGRLIDFKNGSSWYPIDVKNYSLNQYSLDLNINEDLTLSGNVDHKTTGYHALSSKKSGLNNPIAYRNSLQNEHEELKIDNFEIITTDKSSDEFYSKFSIETDLELVGNSIFLDPFQLKVFTENPFKLQERSYPIDFGYKNTFIFRIKINVDESYEIKELPESLNMKLPNNAGSFVCSFNSQNNDIIVYYKLSLSESIYPPEYYEGLKILLSEVVTAEKNSLIVLNKIQ